MMVDTRSICSDRVSEIRGLRELINALESQARGDQLIGGLGRQQRTVRSLYSSFILMHYSLLEAVLTVGVTELFEKVRISQRTFDGCSEEFQKFILHSRLKELKEKDFSLWTEFIFKFTVVPLD